jgi:hypothetical protein
MVFDPIRGRMVLFGGAGDGLFHGDTWLWSGSDWTLVATEGPVPRAYHGMAWDETRGVILLFGGSAWPSTSLNDTWEWDGASWLDVSAPGSPSARRYHALVGHPVRGRVVLSGGWTLPGGMLDDTWEWDGARRTWSPVLPRATIGGRFQHQVVYDRWRSRLVAFGGFYTGLVNETWTFLELHLDAIPPQPAAGQSVAFMLASARDPGVPYVLAASFARAPGLPVHPDGRVLSLARDPLFDWSAGALLPPFLGFQGALDASGRTKAAVEIPPVPALAGLRFYVAGVAYDPQFVRTVFTEIEVRVR